MAAAAPDHAGVGRSRRFTRGDRLRKRYEFRFVRDRSRRVHTRSFLLLIAPGATTSTRLGITVAKAVGTAVRRNRIKRLLREVFRQHRELFPTGSDVVVIAKNGCQAASFRDVHAELAMAGGALRGGRRPRTPGGSP